MELAKNRGNKDSVKKPCATVDPNGLLAARAGSTCIHWWSPVASANPSIMGWSIVTQSLVATSDPIKAINAAPLSNSRIRCLQASKPITHELDAR